MGSSETGGVVDCSVGSIVWVRRRNGSWWPGKILRPEELLASHITSPRSGTPVKLLGREDASVDWYNLEKSKRVKAFRCGEFDDCIERAEAAHGMPPKKREKYARREDAILHALELEMQLLEKKFGQSGNLSNGQRKSPDAVMSSECLENGAENQLDPRSGQLPAMLGLSVVEKNGSDQHPCKETVINQPSGDDDSAGALPRMRGLQDLGLRTTPPTGEKHSGIAISRAKRSRTAYLTYDSGNCSNDNQTLTTQMEIPVSKFEESSYQADAGDHNSGSTEDTETDCSETDSVESDSDEEMAALSDGAESIELQPKYPRNIEAHEEHGSISSRDEFDEMAYADGLPHGYISNSGEVSKWQLKGKRNNRNIGKKYSDPTDAELPKGYTNNRNSNWSNGGFKADPIDKSLRNHASRYGSTGLHNSNETAELDDFTWNNQSIMRGYWEDSHEYVYPFSADRHPFGGRTMLIDVDLEVQANNYRRDVPMISLMSKLNGHAIIGHPIQIEALESGSSENHVSTTDYFHPEPLETPALTSVWRTGRRTANSRVPRPFLNGESKQHSLSIDQDARLKGSMMQKSYSQYPLDRKISRNSPKKNSLSSNLKIRSLSSIASGDQHQSEPRNDANNFQVGGMIKTGNLPTTVACIPVSLVFSRLHEELVGRHQ
ncbi:hypothetical protein SASPL_135138 [Salvia splendens]|uniref:PWWP domain-containing protein n=2 Tax=Salvia splendens TaxID=180675 RepID=A0A8X8WZ22_SALSN|nr:uncharacterized protein At1g51745-like isoform X1 [Salvia splendens]KAG6402924.1 hypothetical protein SASPL_135138 [Salvia splendens]